MGDLLGSPHLVTRNKTVRWKPFVGLSEQYCVEVGGVLHIFLTNLRCILIYFFIRFFVVFWVFIYFLLRGKLSSGNR